jgi:hypothetical protein
MIRVGNINLDIGRGIGGAATACSAIRPLAGGAVSAMAAAPGFCALTCWMSAGGLLEGRLRLESLLCVIRPEVSGPRYVG